MYLYSGLIKNVFMYEELKCTFCDESYIFSSISLHRNTNEGQRELIFDQKKIRIFSTGATKIDSGMCGLHL